MYKFWRILFALVLTYAANHVYAGGAYEVVGTSLKIGDSKICLLDRKARYAIESFDRSAIMLSETTYVDKHQLDQCQTGVAVHVLSIPTRVGVLSDINISKGIYVALDFVDVRPFLYLATVARVGNSKNIVSLKGAYVVGKKISELRRAAFNSSGEAGASIISPDGRYVAPTGEIDCSKTSYPGVWDIKNNRRVVVENDVCAALFKK
ncbi:hypothetical protein [Burkholderia cenocepacia]|uniref:hypothetical protein n=1 Tax=Burkholderia cenocepacia TaxID=95486 RepID=UPI00196B18A6|nr:hypothetical protein [Burkholderia cenocepacia]MBN3566994.1 hypothetical protein [Burkholderia cenocepacia]MBR8110456.1 hypothetical protein [Burkholderia cenocepacia]